MDTIEFFLENREHTLIDACKQLSLLFSTYHHPYPSSILFKLIKEPFTLYRFEKVPHHSVEKIGYSRAYLINHEFIYKNEGTFVNSLALITNLFAKLCGLHTPNMILGNPRKNEWVQIIEYIPNWIDYSHEHPRSGKFVKQLASLLAFDLVIENNDRFLFIFRYISIFILKENRDEEDDDIDIWIDPPINEGNFGFVGSDLWSLDERANDMKYIRRTHSILYPLDDELLNIFSDLMGQFFKLDQENVALFSKKLKKYLARNFKLFPVFKEMYDWIQP